MGDRWANDNYGYVLVAQPGQSQGRPTTIAGSKPIMRVTACPTYVLPGAPDPVGTNVLSQTLGRPVLLSWPYNYSRPHRGLQLATPVPPRSLEVDPSGPIRRRDLLGGLIHEYERAA